MLRAAVGTALLLDAAGTVLRPAAAVAEIYARFAVQHGGRATVQEVATALPQVMRRARPLRARRADWRPYWAEVVSVATGCASPQLLDALLEYYARPQAWKITEGAEACARAVAERGMKVAIVSNWDDRLRALLGALGVTDWIDTAVISAEVGVEKPDPRIFARACERLSVQPASAVHIGDDHGDDVAGARAAGCQVLHWPREVGSFAALARRLLSPAVSRDSATEAPEPARRHQP